MFIHKKIILIIISVMFLFLLSSCNNEKKDDIWDVASIWLPPDITPRLAHGNIVYYVVRQTHEPIFRMSEDNNFYSNILKNWSRTDDYKNFNFCIKENLVFRDKIPFSVNHLEKSLLLLSEKDKDIKVSLNGSCVKINSFVPKKNILDQLTGIEYSPTEIDPKTGFEIGLGAFEVKSKSESELILERKTHISNGFNYIRLVSIIKDPEILHSNSIEDYNLLPIEKIPYHVKKSYEVYPVSLLKVYGLVLNINNKKIRDAILNCLNLEKFKKSYFPQDNNLIHIASVLPIGIEGSTSGSIKQNCNVNLKNNNIKNIEFANWKPEANLGLELIFKDLFNKTNIKIKVKDYDPTELGNLLFKKKSGYDLMVVALDTSNDEYLPFFEPLVDSSKKIHSVNLSKLQGTFEDLKAANTKSSIVKFAKKLNDLILTESIFIPIIQQTREYYFPKDIKNLNLSNNFMGYLEIESLRR